MRAIAEAGPIGKRHTSFELYELLGKCMGLAERCTPSTVDYDELRRLVISNRDGRNRRYLERASDEFILVCRFVFGGLKSAATERSNASRYACSLRQAQSIGLTSATLAEHLRDKGGVNALFLHRPLAARRVSTKILHLDRAVDMPKNALVRLTLRRLPDGTFEVVTYENLDMGDDEDDSVGTEHQSAQRHGGTVSIAV